MNYLIPDSDHTLFVTHEFNYRNLKIYSAGQQLIHLANSEALRDGHTFQNEVLGEIDLRLSNKGNKLEIRVNGLMCDLENPTAVSEENLMGLSSVFRAVAILSSIGVAIQFYALLQIGLDVADIILALFFSLLCTAVYYLAAIFTKKGKVWAYFVGTVAFLIMTLIYGINILASGLMGNFIVVFSIFLMIRLGILVLLLYYFKSVIRVMNGAKNDTNRDILDSFQV